MFKRRVEEQVSGRVNTGVFVDGGEARLLRGPRCWKGCGRG